MRLYNDAKSRIGTRMKGNYFGRSILDSSPNSLTNPIDDYIVNYASADDSNFIVKGSMWEWEPEEYEEDFKNGDVFKVFTGGKGQPPRILEDNDPLLSDPNVDQTKIITVPAKGTDGKMKQYFIDDLPKSLKDRAGIPTDQQTTSLLISKSLKICLTIILGTYTMEFMHLQLTVHKD